MHDFERALSRGEVRGKVLGLHLQLRESDGRMQRGARSFCARQRLGLLLLELRYRLLDAPRAPGGEARESRKAHGEQR